MSRLVGGKNTDQRTEASKGQILLQESSPVFVSGDEIDYAEQYPLAPIGEERYDGETLIHTTTCQITLAVPKDLSARITGHHWTHFSLYRTEDLDDPLTDLANATETYIWVKDVPIARPVFVTRLGATPGVLTVDADQSPLQASDIGSIINIDGDLFIIQKVISTSEGFVTDENGAVVSTSKSNVWGVIGGDYLQFISLSKPTGSDVSLYVKSGVYSDESIIGKQLVFPDGKIGIVRYIEVVGGNTIFGVCDLNGITATSGAPFAAITGSGRTVSDDASDEIIRARKESGEPLYFLQTRFFKELPSGKLGAVSGGAYFVARYRDSEYYYSQLANIFRAGYYHPAFQYNQKPVGSITRLAPYQESVCVFGKNFTYYLDTTVVINSGEPRVGEFIATYGDPRLLSDNIGVVAEGSCAKLGNGSEMIFTGEPAVRMFNGSQYSDNYADGTIQNSKLAPMFFKNIMNWDSLNGLKMWGSVSVPGRASLSVLPVPEIIGDIIETGDNEFVIIESGNQTSNIIEDGV